MTKQTTKSVEIFGPSFSNFVRSVMLLCEEYGVEYTTGLNFDGKTIEYKSAEHLQLHPYGKFPLLKHDDLILSETASICRYIQTTFDQDIASKFSIQQLARIDAFSALISIYIDKAIIRDYLLEFAFPKGKEGEVRLDVAKEKQADVHKAFSVIERELSQGDSLNNEHLSIADALIAPMLHYVSTLPAAFNVLPEYQLTNRYLAHLMAKESVSKVLTTKR
ncbi:glutathione S-transferase family protein [Colwelliaceae bacterium 6441]